MKLYSLAVNGEVICEVSAEVPACLPIRPKLDKRWLKGLVNIALRNYFSRDQKLSEREVVKA